MKITPLDIADWHKVLKVEDVETGLRAIIALHSINLGPACGGCRVFDYPTFDDGLEDVLRLSRGMTYKNALAGIPFGGGKSVIFANPQTEKTEAMLESFGRALEQLEGQYIAAQDSGITIEDMRIAGRHTKYVSGIPDAQGRGGSPAPHTAYGVWRGIKATAEAVFGSDNLKDKTITINGVGAVGMALAEHLYCEGAHLIVADINDKAVAQAVERYEARPTSVEEISDVPADIYAPCALGGAINHDIIDRLNVKAVAGAANNQLATAALGQQLADKGILYAPDFVINAGGVISIGHEVLGDWNRNDLYAKLDEIPNTLRTLFRRASAEGQLPGDVANAMAEEIFLTSN